MMWVRWTLPRLRVDQVMTTCWKYCVPIGCICFVAIAGWQLFWPLGFINDLAPTRPRGEIRESWAVAPPAAAADESTTEKPEKVAASGRRQGGDL
jgi:NADH-quinone oxidoreductase subunit H